MAGLRFVCNAVDTFDLFALREWARSELAARALEVAED